MNEFFYTLPVFKKGKTKLVNSLWAEDVLPLEYLQPGQEISIAEIQGSGIITHIHVTSFFQYMGTDFIKTSAGRGIVFKAYWDDEESPSILCPLADFFADGFGGKSPMYSSLLFEKSSGSWNCYVPMPFVKSAKLVLKNETSDVFKGYATVTYRDLRNNPEVIHEMGRFHTEWKRKKVNILEEDYPLLEAYGHGHYVGCNVSIQSSKLCFLEGNIQHFIDGETIPSVLYLGLEDYFGGSFYFSAGPFSGLYCGAPIKYEDSFIGRISAYRFMLGDSIPFTSSITVKIDWKHDILRLHDVSVVDISSTSYWYQTEPHAPFKNLPSLDIRLAHCLWKIL